MRDISALHPDLQKIIPKLKDACAKRGITIGIGECVRTKAEQDALYAQGRTTKGNIVTNAKGSTYSSMHQWGVAFDFYLLMDIDGDGKTSDDAFNNAQKTFNKVGEIGQKLGLEWGGSWKSPVDLPHFQLPNWGSTATKLKSQYGTPEKFMATWKTSDKKNASTSKTKTEAAQCKDSKYDKEYTTTADLNLRNGTGTLKLVMTVIPKGTKVRCYGYYTKVDGTIWLYVSYGKQTGFVCLKYLK